MYSNHLFLMENLFLPSYFNYKKFNFPYSQGIAFDFLMIQRSCYRVLKACFILLTDMI